MVVHEDEAESSSGTLVTTTYVKINKE